MYSEKQIKEHEQWNEDINIIPSMIAKGQLNTKDDVIVKPFKITLVTKTKSGIIEPRYRAGVTDGGRPKSEIDNPTWQSRGVIVKVHPQAEHNMKEGDIVWFRPNFTRNNDLWLLTERDLPVSKPSGYMKLNQNWVEFVEARGAYELKTDNEVG
jgi:hypothetical protein